MGGENHMQFPDSFFEDEVRHGFYIPALMKRAWAAQLEVLQDIARVCEKYHIRWFADEGTLLGAVRHNGFIPWDDDVDITMFREDYIRFNAVVEKELPDYHIFIPPNIGSKHCIYTCLSNSDSIRWSKTHMEKYHGFPLITGIDIFPLDYIAPDPDEEELRESLATIVRSAAQAINEKSQDTQEMKSRISQIEELLGVQFDNCRDMKEQLFSLLEGILAMYNTDMSAREAAVMHYWIWYRTHKVPIRCFDDEIMLPFETIQIPVPAGYDEVLTIKYGDYMKFSYSGDEHNYPYYDFMIKRLANLYGENQLMYHYCFSEDDLNMRTSDGIRNQPPQGAGARKEIVFLAWKSSMWNQLRPAWEFASSQPDCQVFVIPVPYFHRDTDGNLGEMKWGGQFPDDVPITNYKDYDFENRRPAMIVIQNPYDECNPSTSVHPSFYARNLRKYTEQLVYIPWFITNEIEPNDHKSLYNMQYYAAMPGVVLADQIIVQSGQMRVVYISFLTTFAGENTKKIWEEKIICNFQIPFLKMK